MKNVSQPLVIRPEIRDGKIVTIEIGYESIPLKKPIPLSEFSEIINLLEKLNEYIDFGGQSGWSFTEIDAFIWGEISEKAHDFFKILAEYGDWVKREVILKELKISGRVLAGALSSPGQYFSRYKKDPIYEKMSRLEESEKEIICYRIKPDYLDLIRVSYDIENKDILKSKHINVLFEDNFEGDEVDNIPIKWELHESLGKIRVNSQINKGGINKFVTITSPNGSVDFISKTFDEKDNINLTYYVRQEKYNSSGVGAGLHLFYNNLEAIWLCITNKKLTYYDNKYNPIMLIELGKWYKIQIKSDCKTNSFSCIVDDKMMVKNGDFRNKVPYINKISSTGWNRQDEWSTSFDNVKIVELK